MEGKMPLIEALYRYIDQEVARFHMPGHKGGRGFKPGFLSKLAGMDVTEIPGLDNLHQPMGVIAQAQEMAARAFGADQTFFLVNGSTCGIQAMIMAACRPGQRLIVPRNCHKSVWSAMVLGDIQPVYIQPEFDVSRSLATQVHLREVERALDENPDVVGMMMVHPNYYGMCSHIKEIAKLLHKKGKVLLVDEAHGAHFPFHRELPPSAGEAGADMWVQSAHKTLPAFTQAAYLHVRKGRIDISRVAEVLRIVQSTSPSYILMASLDWARDFMASRGEVLIGRLLERLKKVRVRLQDDLGIRCLGQGQWEEVGYMDPTRLVLDVRSLGLTGYEAERLLRGEDVQVEMSDLNHVVLICTIADDETTLNKVVDGCNRMAANNNQPAHVLPSLQFQVPRRIPEQVVTPRQAFYSEVEWVPINQSHRKVSAGMVGAYPPGIPMFCPGELIDREGVEQLLAIKQSGGSLFGLTGDGLIPVLKA